MKVETLEWVESFWCTLLGVRPDSLFRGVSVSEHVGLGDYPGIVVVARGDGCHVSAPRSLLGVVTARVQGAPCDSQLRPEWWGTALGPTYDVLGPNVHHYLDDDGQLPRSQPVSRDPTLLSELRDAVGPGEWAEGGFAENPGTVFVAVEGRQPVAAANLTAFGPVLADVGVVTHPAHRGRGFGQRVAAAATAHSLQVNGLARWRARAENTSSLAIAARLGFEPWCRQLAVRPH